VHKKETKILEGEKEGDIIPETTLQKI